MKARDEVEEGVERYLENYESGEESDSSSSEDGEPERKWDCESILSTYSNIYNHPKLISEPRNAKIKGLSLISFNIIHFNIFIHIFSIDFVYSLSENWSSFECTGQTGTNEKIFRSVQ